MMRGDLATEEGVLLLSEEFECRPDLAYAVSLEFFHKPQLCRILAAKTQGVLSCRLFSAG